MRTDTGSFIEKTYFPERSSLVTSCLVMGALCAPAPATAITPSHGYLGKNSETYLEERIYQPVSPTWSPLKLETQVSEKVSETVGINVAESLSVVKKMAFLAVDEAIDNEIESYFASKPVKTKTILVNSRINQE